VSVKCMLKSQLLMSPLEVNQAPSTPEVNHVATSVEDLKGCSIFFAFQVRQHAPLLIKFHAKFKSPNFNIKLSYYVLLYSLHALVEFVL